MIVLLTLAKLLPSVLHSHPAPDAGGGLRAAPANRQTDRPIASVAATPKPNARSPEVTAPPAAAAVRSADAPTAVPAAPDRPRADGSPGRPRGGKLSCISFQAELCPPLNLSLQTPAQQSQTHARCAPLVRAEQTQLAPGGGFCGTPLPRANPCWEEGGRTFCLPRFYILGEMKCGTTTLYQLLAKHPRIALPRTKEPRYLMRGRHEDTSISRYAVEFEAAARRPDSLTFDASPTHLQSRIAPPWLRRFLPTARLIVLLRDPVQRAYSHWKMGHEWFESKPDCGKQKVIAQGLPPGGVDRDTEEAIHAAVRREVSFDGLIERSLMQVHLRECKVQTNTGPPVRAPAPSRGANATARGGRPSAGPARPPPPWPWLHFSARGKPGAATGTPFEEEQAAALSCLRQIDAELTTKFLPEFNNSWPAAAISMPISSAMSRVGQCSEFMMVPGNLLTKGARYAENLESWFSEFPREQLLVIHTDDLTTSTQSVMSATFAHLGLPMVDVGTQSRFCVRGKAGVISVLREADLHLHLGENATDGAEGADPTKLQVGECEPDAGNAPNVSRHSIEPELEQRMRRYYRPFNEKLYALLGRDFGW